MRREKKRKKREKKMIMLDKYDKFVFSGSGLLFFAHLGAFKFLSDNGFVRKNSKLKFVGTSGGALVASLLATKNDPSDIKEVAKDIYFGKDGILKINWKFWQPARSMGLLSLEKMEEKLRKNDKGIVLPERFIDYDKDIDLIVVTTDVESKKPFYFSKENTPFEITYKCVRASCSAPFIFTPVELKTNQNANLLLSDGGIVNNYPIDFDGSDRNTIGFRIVSGGEGERCEVKTRFDYISSILNSMLCETRREHLEDAIYAKTININIPDDYSGFDFINFKEEDVDKLFDIGYKEAEEAFFSRRR
jgi:NTE family protein